jgi:hypothetical protein
MLRVSTVLRAGLAAYRAGRPRDVCPYDPPEADQFHTYKPPRRPPVRVRVAIDFAAIWQRGWQLGEYLDQTHSPSP